MRYLGTFFFTCFAIYLVAQSSENVIVGAERMDLYLPLLQGKKVALVVNATSMVGSTHLADTLLKRGITITGIFAPEHGFRGKAEAGEHVHDGIDTQTGVRVISLYGKKKKPTAQDLADTDLVIFDIQDVGVRFYTYMLTLHYVMEACSAYKKTLIVLDRPNPNGHIIDGPVLEDSQKSFLSIASVPIAHGCTMGELALMFKGENWVQDTQCLDLHVITCLNYTHSTRYTLPVRPSPNLPDQRAVLLYPSICLFEGTKLSVGRGTDTPFQCFGYPGFEMGRDTFVPRPNAGSKDPVLNGQTCIGFNLSNEPLDSLYAMHEIDLHWLLFFFKNSPRKDDFFLKNNFFNLLTGNTALRIQIEQGDTEAAIRASWQPGLTAYKAMRKKYLLYE